jgi:hypothetical protein
MWGIQWENGRFQYLTDNLVEEGESKTVSRLTKGLIFHLALLLQKGTVAVQNTHLLYALLEEEEWNHV